MNVPQTLEEWHAVAKRLDAAHYFANASEDPDEIQRANAEMRECEAAIAAAPFDYDDDGNPVTRT